MPIGESSRRETHIRSCEPTIVPARIAGHGNGPPRMGGPWHSDIGVPGFEPGTSPTRTERATKLRHTPMPSRGMVSVPARVCQATRVQENVTKTLNPCELVAMTFGPEFGLLLG
jgi:hypothetical protein